MINLDEGTEITNESLDSDNKEKTTLTDWANEPSISDLKQDYTDSLQDKEDHTTKVDTWLDNLNITGSAKLATSKERSTVQPQLIRKQAEWRYASLSEPFLSTEDIFNVEPITHEDKGAAVQNALVLNNQLNTKINKIKFIDDYVRTAVDEGTVILRVGWNYQEEEVEVEVPDFQFLPTPDPQAQQTHAQIHQLMQQNPQQFREQVPPEMQQAHQLTMQNGTPIMPIPAGSHMETQTKVIKNCPTVEVLNYKNVSIDPTCMGDLDKANFLIYSFESNLSELEKEGKYKNLDKINIESNSILGEPDHGDNEDSNFNFTDKPRKKFVVYEYWGFWDIDGEGQTKPIVASWVGDTLIRLEENPFPDQKLPFVSVQYLPVRRSIYGEPDGELLLENQKIVGAVTRGMIDIMGRSANGQMGSRKDALDLSNKRKFDAGKDYEFNAQVDPRQAFFMHTFPEIPQSAQYMLGLQNADAESLTGVKAFSSGDGGISGKALGNTATGIRSAMDATSKRELGILRRLAEGMKQVGRKIISMNAEFLEDEEIIRITNDEFVPVRRDDLQGKFDLRLTISTAEADNQKAEELAFMLQTTAQSMGPEFAQIILADIAKLRKMPDLAKRIKEYQPQPDPMEQQLKQLEMQKLQAEIQVLATQAQENQAEAQLDMAKAADLGSGTDQKNLDFLDQQSGLTQARDVEKLGVQAEGNRRLENQKHVNKVRENFLKPKTSNQSK